MTVLRRLDHVAVVVRDTEAALAHFRDRLGLEVAYSEVLAVPHVRLTFLDAGNAYVQLVEPLDPELELARFLEEHGEGLHHICFAVDDVAAAAAALAPPDAGEVRLGSGLGRVAAFVPGPAAHGVPIECTEFRPEDVEADARLAGRRPGGLGGR